MLRIFRGNQAGNLIPGIFLMPLFKKTTPDFPLNSPAHRQ